MSDTFFRLIECGAAHIYVLAVQVVRPGDPLICASRAWRWTALVAHFDGSCHRADAAGGAGVIVRKFAGDDYEVLAQTAYPLPDCPDSYHAEGFLASLYPNHSDVQECLIIADNSSILSYWRRTAQVRRPALITVLHQAQLIAATELPRISWRYVPHEANKEAHTQAIRDDCPVLQNLDETAALFPFVPTLPASEAFVKNCMARPEVLWTPIASDTVVTLYTDGAGKNPTSSVCDTAFAVVLLEDLSNHCIGSLAHDARLSGVAPPVFSVFSTGKTRGRQTVSRAELSAAIVAIGSFRNLRLVTDSMYVINTIAAVRADPRPPRWVNRPNFDLVLRLIKALEAHPGVRSIQVDKIKSHQDNGGDVRTLSDPKLIDFWGNHLADEAAGAALEADSQAALLVRDTAQAAVGFRKRHWGLVMSGVAKTVRAFPVIRADDNPRAAGREAADAQLVPVAIPFSFEPLTLPSPVILQYASPWTHTFTHALYNWVQKLCWPTTPVETRGVSSVELLISFKLEMGLNVPVANPDDPGSFTLSRIKPAVSDLTSLGDESRRFSSAIQSLETSLQAFVLPWSEPFFGAVTTLGYPFGMMKLSGFKVRPWIPHEPEVQRIFGEYLGRLTTKTLALPLQGE